MIRLRLPAAPSRTEPSRLPPELRWDAPRGTVTLLLSRRQFLRASAVVLAATALPLGAPRRVWARARGRFLTSAELATLTALCDRVIPPDHDPGGRRLGAPAYIQGLLSAFDGKKTPIFAGGPFSNRNRISDENGDITRKKPKNEFAKFIAPTRLQELHWRAGLFGSAAVPEVAALDAQYGGPLVGLRDVYRAGLARVDELATTMHGKRFAKLDTATQDELLAMFDDGAFEPDARRRGATFIDHVIRHTIEGSFAAPEYGGNKKARGWTMIGLEGDSQPLGYSLFASARDEYVERPDHPMSTPNPDEIDAPRALTADGVKVQNSIHDLTAGFANGDA